MLAQEVEQGLDTAELNRSEPPSAAGKTGLAMIVAVGTQDLGVANLETREVDGTRCRARMPCAVQAEDRRSPRTSSGRTMSCAPSAVRAVTNGRSIRPAPDARILRPSSRHLPRPAGVIVSPDLSSVFQAPSSRPACTSAAKRASCSARPWRDSKRSALTWPSVELTERQAAMPDRPEQICRGADWRPVVPSPSRRIVPAGERSAAPFATAPRRPVPRRRRHDPARQRAPQPPTTLAGRPPAGRRRLQRGQGREARSCGTRLPLGSNGPATIWFRRRYGDLSMPRRIRRSRRRVSSESGQANAR